MTFSKLTADIDFLARCTSASYPLVDKTRNINVAYQDIARLIWESASGWRYDDSNATTLPISQTTLVHNQQDYSIPTTAQRIHRVEVKDNGGNWVKLSPLDLAELNIAEAEFLSQAGLPRFYTLMGRSALLYPKPHSASVTLLSGIAFHVDRDVTEFATTATTTEPGFPAAFHRILSVAAALDFEQDESQRRILKEQRDRLEKGLVRLYSKRFVENKTTIKPHGKKVWKRYL